MRLLYSAIFTLLMPVIMLRMLWRSIKAPAYRRRLGERLGFVSLPSPARPLIWVHAVSLGETIAAKPLVERLIELYPEHRILVTTTTPTGSAQVHALFGDRVAHVYAPWDTPGAVKRFLHRCAPSLLIIMETELWPNMLHYSHRSGCRVLLANARLSARSAAGYARFPRTMRDMLRNLDWVAAQSAADAERFRGLGADPSRLEVSGSIKFDIEVSAAMRVQAMELRMIWGLSERSTILAASTHEGEEALVLEAFSIVREQHPDALLLLAPRHPERFASVQALCEAQCGSVQLRSERQAPSPDTPIMLIDTLGELLQLFGVADVAVIGGSFIARGGHNPLEAAVWSKPILSGKSTFNFAAICKTLVSAEALKLCGDGEALAAELMLLLADGDECRRRGRAAAEVVEANRGALDALARAASRLLGGEC